MKLYAKALLWILMTTFWVAGAKAQIYEPGKTTPVLGQVQDGGITGCVELTDTYQMVEANITGQDAKSVWLGLLQEGKCGTFNLPFFYDKILGEFDIGHKTAYVVEVRVQLAEWATIFAFIPFKPSGYQLISDDPAVHGNGGHDWYKDAQTTPWSRPRLATLDFRWNNCCNKSEVVRTQFRSSKQKDADGKWHDEWWYLHPATNEWRKIEDDIIHDADDNAPDGKPTLFIYNDKEVCFFLPRGEGG